MNFYQCQKNIIRIQKLYYIKMIMMWRRGHNVVGLNLVGGWWHLDGWQSLEVEERVVHSYEREGGSVSEIEIEYHRAIAGTIIN